MKSSEIQELIKFVAKSGVSEVEIEDKDFKIVIRTNPHKKGKYFEETQQFFQVQPPVAAPVQVANIAPVSTPVNPTGTTNTEDNSKYVAIKSPMIGTFYRKPSPEKPPFVSVGDAVAENTVVCMIEAMKLFNEIEAEIKGKIVKVLVDDGSPVEYDQTLYLVDPA
ncbi:MAG: acetyl-CoA carboxylase, biotin carboxyl carrier protein [Flavobacteriales bacterium CG_4_10_14_0_2_um_filter_32_8]|nr:MAG: acetyl-CoA carboxylase, biotin carboxyl carrier protein [Flavobacteriales bacterium CG_4_10_14_0_2_um_filter_32_8]PJB14527.1 MAG: acetyl-CoA carboxylase, biotin carboxyl carrier protein [Flavobacteriales bacterium CG_4_9_14_3_um_filter_32_8]